MKTVKCIHCLNLFTFESTAIQSTFFPSHINYTCIYICISKMFVCSLCVLGVFLERRGEEGKPEIWMKPNLQAICTSSYKFYSREFQVLGVCLYMGNISEEMKLDGCIKMNQKPYLDAGYLHPYSLWIFMDVSFAFALSSVFWKENRWISFLLTSYNNSLLNFLTSISWLYLFYRGSSLIEFTIHITLCLKSESLNYWRHEFMLWDIHHPNLLGLIWKDGQMSIIILYVGN